VSQTEFDPNSHLSKVLQGKVDLSVITLEFSSSVGKPLSPPKSPHRSPLYFPEESPKGSPNYTLRASPPPIPRRSPLRNMANQLRISWLALGAVVVARQLHDFPKHSEKFLPKYDPDTKESSEDHVSKFMLAVSLMVVEHEYLVCILFPFTFEGKTFTWYFTLPQR